MAQFGWQDLGWSQALPLARDPGAAAEGLVDGLGGGADGGLDVLPRAVVQQGDVAALRLEDLGELADVELGGVGAGGGPVQSRWRRQTVWCGGRRQAMGAVMPRRAVQRRQAGRSSWRNPSGSRR